MSNTEFGQKEVPNWDVDDAEPGNLAFEDGVLSIRELYSRLANPPEDGTFSHGSDTDATYELSFSPDGSYLALGNYETPFLYDLSDFGTEPEEIVDDFSWIRAVEFFVADNQYLGLGTTAGNAYIYSTSDFEDPTVIDTDYGTINSIALSPNGNYLVLGSDHDSDDGQVHVYDTSEFSSSTLSPMNSIDTGNFSSTQNVTFSINGEYLITDGGSGGGGEIYIYETDTWTNEHTLEDPGDQPRSLSLSPSGERLAVSSEDDNVYIYDISSENVTDWGEIQTLDDGSDDFGSRGVNWSLDGEYLAHSIGDTIYIYNTSDWSSPLHTLEDPDSSVRSLAFSPNGDYLAVSSNQGDSNIYIYE